MPKHESLPDTGYRPMKASPSAKVFEAPAEIAGAKLPNKVDLRPYMPPVLNQGQTNSCTANAVAGAYDYWVKRTTGNEYDVSRLFIYYNARLRNGDADKDEGSVIQLAMEGMQKLGACSEKTWPFEEKLVTVKPNRDAYEEGSQSRIKDMQNVPNKLEAWKEALAAGLPIVFGCLTFKSFDDANQRGGVVPMPSPNEAGRESHGGHAMCAVGYSDSEKVFIVRNSWGEDWGDKGYCYMPYNYLMNDQFNAGDNWVFIPEEPLTSPQDTWSNDKNPITNDGQGVNFPINPYPADAYEHVTFRYWEEYTMEWNETITEEYEEIVEIVESEEWESIEDYSVEAAMEFASVDEAMAGVSDDDLEEAADDDDDAGDEDTDAD
ncbi:MAG: C1 family peptidase, partial [Verrucomicrobia bacterium]|nr:C1 family peptidase [Verrucomicrobiota bacterium]